MLIYKFGKTIQIRSFQIFLFVKQLFFFCKRQDHGRRMVSKRKYRNHLSEFNDLFGAKCSSFYDSIAPFGRKKDDF